MSPHTRNMLTATIAIVLSACGSVPAPGWEQEVGAANPVEAQLMREAAALGAAQGAAGIAASFDRSGAASIMLMGAGQAARNALMLRADQQLREQAARDTAEFLRQYGITDEDEEPAGENPLH